MRSGGKVYLSSETQTHYLIALLSRYATQGLSQKQSLGFRNFEINLGYIFRVTTPPLFPFAGGEGVVVVVWGCCVGGWWGWTWKGKGMGLGLGLGRKLGLGMLNVKIGLKKKGSFFNFHVYPLSFPCFHPSTSPTTTPNPPSPPPLHPISPLPAQLPCFLGSLCFSSCRVVLFLIVLLPGWDMLVLGIWLGRWVWDIL